MLTDGSLTHDWFGVSPNRKVKLEPHQEALTRSPVTLATEANTQPVKLEGCVKIAGFGATGTHFRSIFTHRHGARLPMCLVMGPGRRVEARSRCYKYCRFKLEKYSYETFPLCGVQRVYVQ